MRIFTIFFSFILTYGLFADTEPKGSILYIDAAFANIRKGPSLEQDVLISLKKGSKLLEIDRKKRWIKVKIYGKNEKIGWIHSSITKKKTDKHIVQKVSLPKKKTIPPQKKDIPKKTPSKKIEKDKDDYAWYNKKPKMQPQVFTDDYAWYSKDKKDKKEKIEPTAKEYVDDYAWYKKDKKKSLSKKKQQIKKELAKLSSSFKKQKIKKKNIKSEIKLKEKNIADKNTKTSLSIDSVKKEKIKKKSSLFVKFRDFKAAFYKTNTKMKINTGVTLFTKARYVAKGVLKITSTDIWLSASERDKKSSLENCVFLLWDTAKGEGDLNEVKVVDKYGKQHMSYKR